VTILGLHYAIWIVLGVYFAAMLAMGWWSRSETASREGYLLGNRRFGVMMMVMHAFGAGTNPGDVAGVVSKTVSSGASGIWVSWMWLFGTPFYWLIAPVVRRMRCLTLADFFEERFGRPASVLYVVVASSGMVVCLASVLLATTRTAQGMMGKAGASESEYWFFGILFVTTAVFLVYSYWGGIVAAIRTDMVQGLMIIGLSILAIPAALKLEQVGGLAGMRATLARASSEQVNYLALFDREGFRLWTVVLLCVNAPLSALAFPHLISVCGAGRSEWEGRVGFAYGNMLKRICTIGWCVLGLCWLSYLLNSGAEVHPDAAFGDSIRMLLPPVLQGVMLACVCATAMSSGDAFQVTVAGLFSQNIYRVYIRPQADERELVFVTRLAGVVVVLAALVVAILMRRSVVRAILDYFNILSLVGISTAMGLLWRRMNWAGMFCSTTGAAAAFIVTRYVFAYGREITVGIPILVGITGGIIGSLLTRKPDAGDVEALLKKIYTPIGQEQKLTLPLEQVVPAQRRLVTAGGLFVVKPSRESWVGFAVTMLICIGAVAVMMGILKG